MNVFSKKANAKLPADSDYLTVTNGHLSKNGQRVRLWGTVIDKPGKTKADNQAVAKRIRQLGFNAVRFWPTPFFRSKWKERFLEPTDDEIDRIHHLIHCFAQQGITVWCAGFNAVGAVRQSDVSTIKDPESAKGWQEAVGKDGLQIRNCLARTWDPRIETLAIFRMKALADYYNPYRKMRWADDPVFGIWELSNEEWWFRHMMRGEFMRLPVYFQTQLFNLWNDFIKEKYKSEDKLRKAWLGLLEGESWAKGTILLAPVSKKIAAEEQMKALGVNIQDRVEHNTLSIDVNRQRERDIIEFLTTLWIKHKQKEADAAKSWGKSIALGTLIWDTGVGFELQSQWMQQHGDAISHCTYLSGFHHDSTHERFPWYSGLEELPRMAWDKPWVDHAKMEGKPFLVYENQIHNPAKYRTEYPMRMASLGIIQDWDAIIWHKWDIIPNSEERESYNKPMDYSEGGNGYPKGLEFEFDEVQLSSMCAAGAIFRSGLMSQAPNPTTFIFGSQSLYDPEMIDFGKTGDLFNPTTFRFGARILIDRTTPHDKIIGPTYKPRVYEINPIQPTSEIVYNWRKGFVKFDNQSVAMFSGFFAQHGGPVEFSNGIRLNNVTIHNPPGIAYPVTKDEKYVTLAIVANDQKPLAKSSDILISAMSTSFNSGFKLDYSKLKHEFIWVANRGATISVGDLPVLVARVETDLIGPCFVGMHYTFYDWHFNAIEKGKIEHEKWTIPPKPVFIIRLSRNTPK